MSKFNFELNTSAGTYIVTDKDTGGVLKFQHLMSDDFIEEILEGPEDTSRLVEFANEFQDDLFTNRVALNLMGESVIIFNDDKTPILDGGIELRNCILHNVNLYNVSLTNVSVPLSEELDICNSTVDDFSFPHEAKLKLSHCFVNEQYNKVIQRVNEERNEWFMNERVEGELW